MRLIVYVDDIILVGVPEETERVFADICERMRMREVGRLSQVGDFGKFLGREVKKIDGGYALRGSETLIDELVRRTGVQSGHAVGTPAVKYSGKEIARSEELEGAEATAYRGVAGLAIHLGHDRIDVQYAAKEAARSMSHPHQCDWWRVKRLSKYLHHHRSVWQKFVCSDDPLQIEVTVDADWAGDAETRRSTSGGVLALSGVCVSTWSRTQGCVALSSAEAEYMALVLGAQAGLQLSHLLAEMDIVAPLTLYTGSREKGHASDEAPGVEGVVLEGTC